MDPLYLSVMVQAEKKFWRCVQSGEVPHLINAEPPRIGCGLIVGAVDQLPAGGFALAESPTALNSRCSNLPELSAVLSESPAMMRPGPLVGSPAFLAPVAPPIGAFSNSSRASD